MDKYEQLKKDRERLQENIRQLDETIAYYDEWIKEKELNSWDYLYPTKEFVQHLIDHVKNSSSRMIMIWVQDEVIKIKQIEKDSVTIGLFFGGLGLSIPMELAQSMRQAWLLLSEDERNDILNRVEKR